MTAVEEVAEPWHSVTSPPYTAVASIRKRRLQIVLATDHEMITLQLLIELYTLKKALFWAGCRCQVGRALSTVTTAQTLWLNETKCSQATADK